MIYEDILPRHKNMIRSYQFPVNHESTFTGEQMTDAERKDLFWTYYHDLKDTK